MWGILRFVFTPIRKFNLWDSPNKGELLALVALVLCAIAFFLLGGDNFTIGL